MNLLLSFGCLVPY